MDDYVIVDDSIIGRRVIYDDRAVGVVTAKISEGNERVGPDYSVMLENGDTVYITDRSMWKFKIIK
jgi:hypothetical protein